MSIADWSNEQFTTALHLLRWPKTGGVPTCPYCGCQHYRVHRRDKAYTCVECVAQYTARSGTLFNRSKLTDYQLVRLVFASKVVGQIKNSEICEEIGVMKSHGQRWMDRVLQTFDGKLTFPSFYHLPIRTFKRTVRKATVPKIPAKELVARYLLVRENRGKRLSEVVE